MIARYAFRQSLRLAAGLQSKPTPRRIPDSEYSLQAVVANGLEADNVLSRRLLDGIGEYSHPSSVASLVPDYCTNHGCDGHTECATHWLANSEYSKKRVYGELSACVFALRAVSSSLLLPSSV